MGTGYSDPKDPTVRYELSFSRNVGNRHEYGSLTFVGEKLELEQFHYQPLNSKDVLFPAKYTKGEAQKQRMSLLKSSIKPESMSLYQMNTIIIHRLFNAAGSIHVYVYEEKSGVPISDQSINIGVLGDGTVASYYKTQTAAGNFTYDDLSKKQSEADMAKRLQDALKAQLSYRIETDYATGNHSVKLVYQPNSQIRSGVHAVTGQWLTTEGLSSTLSNPTITPDCDGTFSGKTAEHYSRAGTGAGGEGACNRSERR